MSFFRKKTQPTKTQQKEQRLLSATQLSKKIEKEVSPKEINQVLVEIEYLEKVSGGGYRLGQRAEKLGEQKMAKNGVPYVVWKEILLKNRVFMSALDRFLSKGVKPEAQKATPTSRSAANKGAPKRASHREIDGIKLFDRKAFDAGFRTMDGHFVRSKAEVIISDWLYFNRISYAYEKRLPVEEELYSDFFIPDANIYIEFWGYENDEKYLDRKKVKKDLYAKYGFKLVELSDQDIEVLDDILPIKLLKHGMVVGR